MNIFTSLRTKVSTLSNGLIFFILFLALLVLHLFMFSDVVLHLPALLNGDSILSREELVPYFNPQTQFFDQMHAGVSPLTSSPEMRVAYSVLTSWQRYSPILPFGLLITCSLSALIIIYSLYRFAHHIMRTRRAYALLASSAIGFQIYFLILYAKIAHFYTLVFGFALFLLTLVLFIEMINNPPKNWIRASLLPAVLILFNPAIHFHILFYICGLVILLVLLFTKSGDALTQSQATVLRLKITTLIYILSFVPYALFIQMILSTLSGQVSDAIPIDYWMIYYSSLTLVEVITLNIPGHVDFVNYGVYLQQPPRVFGSLFLFLALLGVFVGKQTEEKNGTRVLTYSLFALMVMGIWMSLGYSTSFSMHNIVRGIIGLLTYIPTGVSSILEQLFYLVVQILRYPHRFEFIFFATVALLATLGLIKLYQLMPKMWLRPYWVVLLSIAIMFSCLVDHDYRTAVLSGDFASFLSVWNVPEDLKEIRAYVQKNPSGTLLVLPSLEGNRKLISPTQETSFLDKTLIYYLDYPSFYYGTGATAVNKLRVAVAYQAIESGANWWDNYLVANIDIEYLLIPTTKNRGLGVQYLPNFETNLQNALSSSDVFTQVYSGTTFNLYKAREEYKKKTSAPFLYSIDDTVLLSSNMAPYAGKVFFPNQLTEYVQAVKENNGVGYIYSDHIETALLDITSTQATMANADKYKMPFNSNLVSSSFYFTNTFTLFTMFDDASEYNQFRKVWPSLNNITTPTFYGVTSEEREFTLSDMSAGVYMLFARGYALEQDTTVTIDSNVTEITPLTYQGNSPEGYQYYILGKNIALEEGNHVIHISHSTSAEEKTPIIEKIFVLEKSELKSGGMYGSHIEYAKTGDRLYSIRIPLN